MSLADHYRRQLAWRDWRTVLDALPPLEGRTVLDLGCGVGDLSAELVTRGARVLGVDLIEDLIGEARSRRLRDAEFRVGDLRKPLELGFAVDGLWGGFVAAYFPDLSTALTRWARDLAPGGWIALTEIDDLFGHEPLSAETRALLDAYADDALAAGRYDFRMGRKLGDHVERAGFEVTRTLTLQDRELSFAGPADPDVVRAWRERFTYMSLLREFCGPRIARVEEEFLGCLERADHRSTAQVRCCIAAKPDLSSR